MKPKVLIYITRMHDACLELLAFRHCDQPSAGLQVPAGTVDEGEEIVQAAKREAFEESGLVLDDALSFRGAFEYIRPDNSTSHLRHVFHHHITGDTQDQWTHVVSGEGDDAELVFEYAWYPLAHCVAGLIGQQGRYLPSIYKNIDEDILVRVAVPGEEAAIHDAHMRSIREICVKDHGLEEVRGWGYRPLENRWVAQIRTGYVWIVEYKGAIHGVGNIRMYSEEDKQQSYLNALYLTPDVQGKGVGSVLITLMIETAKDLQASTIFLDSTITGKRFYERNGFVDCGSMKKVDIGGYPVTCFPMRMDLES